MQSEVRPTSATSPPDANALRVYGRMVRADRETILWLLAITVVVVVSILGPFSPLSFMIYTVATFTTLAWRLGHYEFTREPVELRITGKGLELTRRNRTRQLAPWRYFESASLQERSKHYLNGQTAKLTLENAFRPAIGSFLHTRDSEQTVFFFPIIVLVESPVAETEAFAAELRKRIAVAQREPQPGPRRQVQAPPDPAHVLRLHNCMQCAYSLRGLKDDGRCPECGWTFDHHMFMLDAMPARTGARMAAVVAIGFAAILISVCTGSLLVLAAAITAAGVFTVIQHWTNVNSDFHPTRLRFLVCGRGIEIWRGNQAVAFHRWRELQHVEYVWSGHGRWRLAAWSRLPWSVRYSRFFETWRGDPLKSRVFDVHMHGRREAGEIACEEVRKRWQAAMQVMRAEAPIAPEPIG